jgi:hypothetical protein
MKWLCPHPHLPDNKWDWFVLGCCAAVILTSGLGLLGVPLPRHLDLVVSLVVAVVFMVDVAKKQTK